MDPKLKFAKIGGMKVSKICLGLMSYGKFSGPGVARHTWSNPDFDNVFNIMKAAVNRGVNFFDTANVYSGGDSEVLTGRCLKSLGLRRSEYVLATKLGLPMNSGPNETGLSRKHIMESVDASLKRLDLDYVDLLIVHRLDRDTPAEEIMSALHDVVKSGKALYIGASSMYAWEFAKLQQIAQQNGWTKFVSMQNYYNLLYREEEREMLPLLQDQNVLCTPWSPLARGVLARPFSEMRATKRSNEDLYHTSKQMEDGGVGIDTEVLEAVGKVASDLNQSRAAVSLAWLIHKNCVPVLGATSIDQLNGSLDALDISLSNEHIELLESHYKPKAHGVGVGR
mmetsp:Transcript_14073/g.16469  ORF Transcript_14073/g.16469 Transcript_14073/m.16469 type:complete len:338 (+) Transcript_14073:90-1103(+)